MAFQIVESSREIDELEEGVVDDEDEDDEEDEAEFRFLFAVEHVISPSLACC